MPLKTILVLLDLVDGQAFGIWPMAMHLKMTTLVLAQLGRQKDAQDIHQQVGKCVRCVR